MEQEEQWREFLERLREAVPKVCQWITDLQARHALKSFCSSDLEIPLLNECFGADLLKSTRVVLVDQVPFPPAMAYGLPEFEGMANMDMAGITFGSMYFIRPKFSADDIHFHELVHVVQWKTLGVQEFLQTYAVGIVQHGYERSPLEAMAFSLQGHFVEGTAPLPVLDLVGRHAIHARNEARALFQACGVEWGI